MRSKWLKKVSGPGVVGEQPLLQSGEVFSYTSGCVLSTPGGVMEGCYEMLQPGGHTFDARIAPFVWPRPDTYIDSGRPSFSAHSSLQ